MPPDPETYYLTPTAYVPNSHLPVLVYRNVLPRPPTAENVKAAIERNGWLFDDVWGLYPTHHFHSVTHECYAVFQGSGRTLLGRGPLDDAETGVEVELSAGDVIVLPAGVSHCNTSSEGDYQYAALYPRGSPKYDINWCQAGPDETTEKAQAASSVRMPGEDPVYGGDGPLIRLWTTAS